MSKGQIANKIEYKILKGRSDSFESGSDYLPDKMQAIAEPETPSRTPTQGKQL